MTNSVGPVGPYVSSSFYLPEDEDERVIRVTNGLHDLAEAVNIREIAAYQFTELLTGQQWTATIANQPATFTPYRQLYTCVLPNAGTVSIPHGITNLIFCTRIYGAARQHVAAADPPLLPNLFIPLPQSAPDDVSITVDQTNINVTTATATYANFDALIILEYFRE